MRAALSRLRFDAAAQADPNRLIALLAKAEASSDGRLRGFQHTMLDDSDISYTRHARAFVCGVLSGSPACLMTGAQHPHWS